MGFNLHRLAGAKYRLLHTRRGADPDGRGHYQLLGSRTCSPAPSDTIELSDLQATNSLLDIADFEHGGHPVQLQHAGVHSQPLPESQWAPLPPDIKRIRDWSMSEEDANQRRDGHAAKKNRDAVKRMGVPVLTNIPYLVARHRSLTPGAYLRWHTLKRLLLESCRNKK